MSPEAPRETLKQTHTFEGPPEEYINDYDVGSNQGIPPTAVPAPTPKIQNKKGFLTTLGKIMSFLHR